MSNYKIYRMVLSISFLLTIPVDCLIVQSTFRKLHRRYFKNIASSQKHNHHNKQDDDNEEDHEEVVIYNSELHHNNKKQSSSSVVSIIDIMEDGWSTYSSSMEHNIVNIIPHNDLTNIKNNNSELNDTSINSSSFSIKYRTASSHLEKIENHTFQEKNNNSNNEFHQSESSINSFNSSSTNRNTIVLRKPSRDEIDQIILANNADRQNKLITIVDNDNEGGLGGGESSCNRLDSSWASVMSHDATCAATGIEKGYHKLTLPLSRGISSHTNNTNTTSINNNNNNALHNMSTSKLAAFILWVLLLVTCFGVKQWMYLAASMGTFCSAVLLFLFPTMLYFRMSLPSDYQASPIIFGLVPNRLYMTLIQLLGIFFILFNIFAILFLFIQGEHAIQDNSEK